MKLKRRESERGGREREKKKLLKLLKYWEYKREHYYQPYRSTKTLREYCGQLSATELDDLDTRDKF